MPKKKPAKLRVKQNAMRKITKRIMSQDTGISITDNDTPVFLLLAYV